METASSNYQISFRPNCIWRALFPWDTIEPKFLAEKSVTGVPKTTRFSGLEISVRNCAETRSLMGMSLARLKSRLTCPGPRTIPTPEFP